MLGEFVAGDEVEYPFGPSRPEEDDDNGIQKIQPLDCFRECLKKDIRLDYRMLNETRLMKIAAGDSETCDGFATVKYGGTIAACGIKAEFAAPEAHAADSGWATITVEVENVDIENETGGEADDDDAENDQVLEVYLQDALDLMLDFRELCVRKGELVWALHVDVTAISDDGNFRDVALLSMLAALENVTLPMVKYDTENRAVELLEPMVKLKLARRLFPFTYVVEGRKYLVDPTTTEEELGSALVSVCLDDDGNLCKFESEGCSRELGEPISAAVDNAKKLLPVVKKRLDAALKAARKPLSLSARRWPPKCDGTSGVGVAVAVGPVARGDGEGDYYDEDAEMYDI